jgi:trans-aconitate 2-methyltransferase
MTWSASQYVKFEDERTRPARDLLAAVPLASVEVAIDLGCGPGNSTALLVERFGAAAVRGLDSDPDMLTAARKRLPETAFVAADLARWQPDRAYQLFYSNAVFQWVPDHRTVLARLLAALPAGGVLAVQMPDNLDEPNHTLMRESAAAGPWREALDGFNDGREVIPPPEAYFETFGPRAARLDIWQTIYQHPLADAAAVVEWVKGTGLRPYLDAIPPEHHEAFLADYRSRIAAAYPRMADGRVLFRFPRRFIVAVKA